MDTFIAFSIFILILLLPTVFFSLVIKSIPKLKVRDAAPYLDKIAEMKNFVNASPVDEADIKNIKRGIQHSVGFLTWDICIDVLAIAGLVSIARDEEIIAGYIVIYIAVVGFLSAICLYKAVKNMEVFRNYDDFSKRNGVLLKYKVSWYVSTAYKRPAIYTALVGTYDDEKNPIVFKVKIPREVFQVIEKNDKWSVVMYKGEPATVIKG